MPHISPPAAPSHGAAFFHLLKTPSSFSPIFQERELIYEGSVAKNATVQTEGNRQAALLLKMKVYT
jgi:hypothetical protein